MDASDDLSSVMGDVSGGGLPVGSIVFLHGLQSRPELDFHVGRTAGPLGAESGRYPVKVHYTCLFPGASGRSAIFGDRREGREPLMVQLMRPVAVKPENLRAVPSAHALIAAERLLLGSSTSSSNCAPDGAATLFERHLDSLKRVHLASLEADAESNAAAGAEELAPQTREHRLMRRCCSATQGVPSAAATAGESAAAPPAFFAEVVQLLGCTSLPRNAVLSVASFLLVPRARIDRAPFTRPGTTLIDVSADSNRGDFPLQAVLSPDTSSWYMSAQPRRSGRGQPRLTFTFPSTRRVSFMGVRIPPMPMGPLSVRTFFLEIPKREAAAPHGAPQEPKAEAEGPAAADERKGEGGAWERVPLGGCAEKQYCTLNVACTQEFAIWPPVDTRAVRMVLTSSAEDSPSQPVGMYYVGFA